MYMYDYVLYQILEVNKKSSYINVFVQ